MEISNNLKGGGWGVARHKGEDKAALMRAGGVGEEKQRWEEVPERAKGGTAVVLSAPQAMSDLSGLRQERRASVVPCDPRLCFMACYRSLSVWEKTRRPVCVSAQMFVWFVGSFCH